MIKEKFLNIQRLGLHATLKPSQIFTLHVQLVGFMNVNYNKLPSNEYYDLLELQFHLALIMGKDSEAKTCLDRLIDKFGELDSPRIAVLKADYLYATKSLNDSLHYIENRNNKDEILTLKKKIGLSKTVLNANDYIKNLKNYLDISPLDTEVWAELAETYNQHGYIDQAIFTYQEVLLIIPFAYNIFGAIGELSYQKFKKDGKSEDLISSIKHFARSIELCSNYAKGWSGILIACNEINSLDEKKLKGVHNDDLIRYKKLQSLSRKKLAEIVEAKDSTEDNIEDTKRVLLAV